MTLEPADGETFVAKRLRLKAEREVRAGVDGETFLQRQLRLKAEREGAAPTSSPARRSSGGGLAPDSPRAQAYTAAMLESVCAQVAATAKGQRNTTLNNAAMRLGHYCPTYLDPERVARKLVVAAGAAGLDAREATATVRSGLGAGMREPRALELEDDPRLSLAQIAGVEEPTRVVDAAEVSDVGLPKGDTAAPQIEPVVARKIVVTRASDIPVRPVRWVWQGRVPCGGLSLIAGREGVGKSTVGYQNAADLTTGRLPGVFFGIPKSVVVAATEDSWEHTIVPRLMAAGADLTRILRVDVVTSEGLMSTLTLPRDVRGLGELIEREDVALVLLDPLMSRLDSSLDSHKDAEVRVALEPITDLAHRTGVAVEGIIHVNKGHSADALDRVMASRAFTAVARSVLFVMKDPDDDRLRLLGVPKNNLGRTDNLPTLIFAIESAHVADTPEGPVWTGKIAWKGEVSRSIDEALASAEDGPDGRTATAEAGDWLEDYLAQQGGEASSGDVKQAGAKAGHSPDALKRARRARKIDSRSHGFPRTTVWSLPGTVAPSVGATEP